MTGYVSPEGRVYFSRGKVLAAVCRGPKSPIASVAPACSPPSVAHSTKRWRRLVSSRAIRRLSTRTPRKSAIRRFSTSTPRKGAPEADHLPSEVHRCDESAPRSAAEDRMQREHRLLLRLHDMEWQAAGYRREIEQLRRSEEARAQLHRAEVGALCTRIAKRRRLLADAPHAAQVRVVSYAELAEATDAFSAVLERLERGAPATLYRGTLGSDDVSVKVFGEGMPQSLLHFQHELSVLSQCRHESMLPLYGVSMEVGRPLCLVYPLMPNGSVKALLADLRQGRRTGLLPAERRVYVAQDIVSALDYLHHAVVENTKASIVHRNVTSSNVFLDVDLHAQLGGPELPCQADRGSVKVERPATPTTGYEDPEFPDRLCPASDIFSYGVLLLELLTGMPPIDDTRRPLHASPCEPDSAAAFPPPVSRRLMGLAQRCLGARRVPLREALKVCEQMCAMVAMPLPLEASPPPVSQSQEADVWV